jgi:hypothetical protein
MKEPGRDVRDFGDRRLRETISVQPGLTVRA